MKTLEQMTFDELVEHAGRQIFSALLKGGGEAMQGVLHVWLGQAIVWKEAQDKMKKEVKKNVKRS